MSETARDPGGVIAAEAQAVTEYIALAESVSELLPAIRAVADVLERCFSAGGTVYSFGNGGSAADAAHLTGELVGHYRADRRPLAATTLGVDAVATSCIANDYDFTEVFARPLRAFARPGDVAVAFTTSGRSPNVVLALEAAHALGATTVVFGGGDAGLAGAHADYRILVPSSSTPRVQEIHTLALHLISERLDRWASEVLEETA